MSNSDEHINMTEEEYAEIELLRKAIEEKKAASRGRKKVPVRGPSSEGGATEKGPDSEVIRSSRIKKGSRKKTSNAPIVIALIVLLIAAVGGIAYYANKNSNPQETAPVKKQGEMKDRISGLEGGVRVAVVSTVRGDMQVNNTGEFIKAAANMTNILESATVKTGSDSFGCIAMSGALVYLDAGTTLVMGKDKMAGPSGAALTVSSGRVYVQAEGSAGYDQFRVSAGGKLVYGPGSEYVIYSSGTVAVARGTAFIKAGGTETPVAELKTSSGAEIAEGDHAWLNAQGARYALSGKVKKTPGTPSATSSSGTGSRPVSSPAPAGFVYSESFSDTKLGNWQSIGNGSWLVSRGTQINHSSSEPRGILLLKGRTAKYFSLKANVKTGREGSIGFVFGYSGGDFYMIRWTAKGRLELVKVSGGIEKNIVAENYRSPDRDKDMFLELLIDTTSIRLFRDNKMVFRHTADGAYTGSVGLLAESNPDAVFSSISVDAREQEKPRF